ncbi:MAG: hypothetical protein HY870_14430 [Chloroflexi bacterium]|nr:hypothetical protein [Chloroflexota bacterium]
MPDRANMPATITIQEEPPRLACLACHAYAGGGGNNKRSDMSHALAAPVTNIDMHMSRRITCVDCHQADDHRIAGRGVDLGIDEGVARRACTGCYNPAIDTSYGARPFLPAAQRASSGLRKPVKCGSIRSSCYGFIDGEGGAAKRVGWGS